LQRVPRRGCSRLIATVKCAAAAPHSFALKQRSPALNASTDFRFFCCSVAGGVAPPEPSLLPKSFSLSCFDFFFAATPPSSAAGPLVAGALLLVLVLEAEKRSPGCSARCAFSRRIAKAGAANNNQNQRPQNQSAQSFHPSVSACGVWNVCAGGMYVPESSPTSSIAQRRNAR
jgi:hypothetical protein